MTRRFVRGANNNYVGYFLFAERTYLYVTVDDGDVLFAERTTTIEVSPHPLVQRMRRSP